MRGGDLPKLTGEAHVIVNQSAPAATVVPILIYADVAKAIEWLCGAFGFVERLRAERNGVVGHAQLVVGEGALMLGRQGMVVTRDSRCRLPRRIAPAAAREGRECSHRESPPSSRG